MRHVYECPLRWSDIDTLGHVNNVAFVDYLQEARVDMFTMRAGSSGAVDLAEGVVVVRHDVEFLAPLAFRAEPVRIDVWAIAVRAASFTLAYEVYDESKPGIDRRVYLRATSVLAPYVFGGDHPRRLTAAERQALGRFHEEARQERPGLGRGGAPRHVYEVGVRFSDVDIYRHVNNVKYFEYIQEARVRYAGELAERAGGWSDQVVARTDMDYRRPMVMRSAPYEVRSWVSGLGNRSFVIGAQIVDPQADGDQAAVLASSNAVMVSFDRHTQAAREMPPEQRATLARELSGSAPPAN